MSSQNPSSFPAVPPSLSAGDHGMRDYYTAQDTPRPLQYTIPQITPYLGLRSRLSQVWINRWTILLLLILVRILIAISGLHNDLASAKSEALSACTAVESMGSTMASLPHYMSQGVNDMAATGVEKAVNGLMSMLFLTITGVEELVVFYINLLTSTYVCLITLAISGSLHVALQVVEDVSNFLNKTLGEIGTGIHHDIDSFQADLNKFTGALNSIPQAFGSKSTIPKLNVDDSLGKLDHLTLPPTLDQNLSKLNASIPTFDQVHNFTNSAIRLPFEEVKKLVNKSIEAFTFDRSVFPVPKKEQLTFCSDNNDIGKFFDGLADIANFARRAFLGVLIVLAVVMCIPMAWLEIRRWRTIQKRSKLVGEKSLDSLDVMYIASRPYTATAGLTVASKISSSKRKNLTRWVVAYATSVPALVVLSLGITGLLACLCQYILLKAVEKEVPALETQIGDFAGKVVNVLNHASESWANGTNHVITTTNNDINNEVFGWVNTTTGALNHTLNVFVDEMTKGLNDTFGGTILYDPILGVFNCLIGLKIAGIEKGLTWVSDHAHIDFPLLPNNTFSLGAAASLASDNKGVNPNESFLSSPTAEATDKITAAVNKVTAHIADAIRTEALISTFILLLWVLVVLMGVCRALFLLCKREKARAEGGPSFAGDIPLTEQPARLDSSPAPPIYEPPRGPIPNTFPSFSTATVAAETRRRDLGNDDEMEWQDRKVGYAGDRGPAQIDSAHVRSSSYGFVEKS